MDGKDPKEDLGEETERNRTLTMKGLEYNKEIKSKARVQRVKALDIKTVELKGLLQHETSDKGTVKNVYSDWLNNYEQLLVIHEQYQQLLSETELDNDRSQFENKTSDYADVKYEAEQWFLNNCSVSEKHEQLETKSHRSGVSRLSSKHSTVSSNISIARLKENQRKAELLARASALKEQQKLEEAKLSLQMKEKELEIKTELQVSDARAKILEDLERSMVDDQILEETIKLPDIKIKEEPPTESRVIQNKYVLNPSSPEWIPKRYMSSATAQGEIKNDESFYGHGLYQHNTDNDVKIDKTPTASGLVNVQSEINEIPVPQTSSLVNCDMNSVTKIMNKPKAEIQSFKGNPIDYNTFLRQFNARVCAYTDSYEERLNFLLQYTEDEAHKIVLGYSHMNSECGYKAALVEFQERYGDPDIIARAYVKRALEWPPIKPDKAQDLDKFGIFLRECQFAVESLDSVRVLEYSENLRLLVQKLPYYLHERWRNIVYDIKSKREVVKFENLVDFVRKEAKKATDPIYGKEVLSTSKGTNSRDKQSSSTRVNRQVGISKTLITNVSDSGAKESHHNKREAEVRHRSVSAFTTPCLFCGESHELENCKGITNLSLKERYAFLKDKGLCFACLRYGHQKSNCKRKANCKICNKVHLTILHVEPHQDSPINTKSTATHTGAGSEIQQALPIVPVRLKLKNNSNYVETYAFLDSGSTASFCTERLINKLNIEGKRKRINMITMGQESVQNIHEITGLEISALNGEHSIELGPVFTQRTLPVSKTDIVSIESLQEWPHLKDLPLQRINSDIDLLIGINVPKAMEPWEVIPSVNGGPFAVKTACGWVINGPLGSKSERDDELVTANFIRIDSRTSLEDQVLNQFNHDFNERAIDDKLEPSVEDQHFLKFVSESISLENGHYTVNLPLKNPDVAMPNNRKQAEQRLILLAKRFKRDSKFCTQYQDFMSKVFKEGYAERVPKEHLKQSDGRVWYLPHHGVFHPKKEKLRVVFDCAARFHGTSLNDQLLQGPNLTNTLAGTLLKFRQEEIAIMGDIDSMFYQVLVPVEDRSFLRFLWWEEGDTSKPVIEYQMTVHLFGSTSSPSCANYALKKTATDCRGQFNEDVVNTVLNNFYVDDCLKSVSTSKIAVSLLHDLKVLLSRGGFNISKWISNSKDVMSSIPITERAALAKDLDLDQDSLPIDRALGLSWCAETDTFRFVLAIKDQPLTRRGILSVVSSVYDPLGFLAPVMLNAKLLLQELCRLQLGWDDPVPPKFVERWRMILCDIEKVSEFKVNRCFKFPGFGEIKHTELHHFSDASESGYGIVSYLRMTNTEDKVHCSFVIGKSRVAPLKKVTVPRLELSAATVAVRTNKMLNDELEMKIDRSVFWTDSMSVLRYVRNTTSRFHTFVANRLMIIHEGSNVSDWRYINTKLNPADIASRGLSVENSLWTERWIEAPKFLNLTEENWPSLQEKNLELHEDDPEVKKIKTNLTSVKSEEDSETEIAEMEKLINYYSSWYKLKKGLAWILKCRRELRKRARQRVKNEVVKPEGSVRLSVDDLLEAERAIVMYVQGTVFKEEIKLLEKGETQVSRKSSIRKLDPYLDDGLLRVGGRLHESSLPAESKHPIILPKGHHLSMLILQHIHNSLKHSGRNHMLSVLRQNYWLINAPSAVRSVISKCVVCRRQKSKVGEQKMSNLPEDRVKPDEPPFTRVGVDYFGPFEVKLRRSRVKRYGVIFTCLASRAVHIEVAYSLDTSSYINALRRFTARRGQVSKMRSDNGTNFVGAERELRESISEWNVAQIHEAMLQRGIEWQFNPPAGSHHGGVWERLIKSVRSAMNSTLKEQILDDEGLLTLMCEIEAVLNSRPITRISDQFGDLEALTPNHLLTLKLLPNLPPGLFNRSDNYSVRRWRQIQYMAELFWKRWSKEYLPLLQERQKWCDVKRNLKTGDIVLIVDSSAPRNSWPMGIVKETIPDRNGLVRQVKVKTATNILVRPIDKLCVLLEMDE